MAKPPPGGWPARLATLVVLLGVGVPLVFLLTQALGGGGDAHVLRSLTADRLGRTLGLAAAVVALSTLLTLPAAWLTARAGIWGRRVWTVLWVLPLAVPGYVMATAALDLGGYRGFLERVFDWRAGTVSGFGGSLVVLTLYTSPYLFLNLRNAFQGLDRARLDAARTLGATPFGAFRRVVLPDLRAAWSAGALLVALHVVGDFGVASLMRYDTLGVAVESAYAAATGPAATRYAYPAGLGLILMAVAVVLLVADAWFVRRQVAARAGARVARKGPRVALGIWQVPAQVLLLIVPLLGVGLPLWMIGTWLTSPGTELPEAAAVWRSIGHAVSASLPAAVLGVLLALPLVRRAARSRRTLPRLLERALFVGYATPRIVLGFAIYVLALQLPDALLEHPRNTMILLVLAYALHFMAEAVGPLRTAFLRVSPRLEDAARTLGLTARQCFWRITVPLVGRGVLVAMTFLFLACMKDLPLTLLLRPDGFETPAWRVWSHASEAEFATAGPYALALVLTSAVFVTLLLRRQDARP